MFKGRTHTRQGNTPTLILKWPASSWDILGVDMGGYPYRGGSFSHGAELVLLSFHCQKLDMKLDTKLAEPSQQSLSQFCPLLALLYRYVHTFCRARVGMNIRCSGPQSTLPNSDSLLQPAARSMPLSLSFAATPRRPRPHKVSLPLRIQPSIPGTRTPPAPFECSVPAKLRR